MDRNAFVWVIECCLLSFDDVDKKKLLEYGAGEQEIEIGVQLCEYLKNKEITLAVQNGC